MPKVHSIDQVVAAILAFDKKRLHSFFVPATTSGGISFMKLIPLVILYDKHRPLKAATVYFLTVVGGNYQPILHP